MSYITLDGIKNPKHTLVLKKLSDIFDNHRGKISDNIAVTFFNNFDGNHTVVFNTESPKHNNKQLVTVGSKGLLYSLTDIDSILCSDPECNTNINVLKHVDNDITWEAVTNDKKIRLQIKLKEKKSTIGAIGLTFTDAVKTIYQVDVIMVNDENQVVSEFNSVRSSTDSNKQQFFQLQNKVEDVNKIILDIEVVGTNIYEFQMKNISIYSHMNMESMKLLSESGIITWTLVPNPVLIKGYNPKDFVEGENNNAPKLGQIPKTVPEETTGFYDSYGTPLPYKPNKDHQYFDEMDTKKLTEIAKAPVAVTKSVNGGEVYTLESDDNYQVNLTLSPTEEMKKYSDNSVIQFPDLINKGYIKNGGFKNYVLAFYIKLDKLMLHEDQYLVWKYAGWMFDKNIPDCARATRVHIPTVSNDSVRIYTEYVYNKWHEITSPKSQLGPKNIPEGQWVGIQFIRQVESPTKSVQTIRVNYNPFDENGKLTNTSFEELYKFTDETTDNHKANTWGGINEIVSINGAKYVNIYGLSLYEIESE